MQVDIKEIAKKNTRKKQIEIKPLKNVDSFEKEMENFLLFMSETISKRFKSQVLDQLNKKTIDKFMDAQIGNYAVVYNKLNKKFEASIKNQFSKSRIKKYINSLYNKIDKSNAKSFYGNINKEIGVDIKSIIKTDGLNSFINAKQLETNLQIGKTLGDQMENLTTNMLRLMSAGQNLESLYEEVENITGKNKNKSELVARNELTTFNTQLSKKRAANLDIKMRKWNTVGDERTRTCHQARDGKLYPVDGKLYSSCDGKSIEAGEEINCRCYDTFVIEID